jgi:hypothetical protein
MDSTITDWILSEPVAPSAKASYLKVAKAIRAAKAKLENNSTQLLSQHLAGLGANIPSKQAPPLQLEHLHHPLLSPHRLALLLAWSTASRWDEIQRLQRDSFIQVSPEEIIVDWFTGTKASRTQPFRASRFKVIRSQFTAELAMRLQQIKPGQYITALSTSDITKILKHVDQSLSAHSLKAGALDHVVRRLADSGKTHLEQEMAVARLAKHIHPLDPNATTLRYIRSPEALARMLGTGETTALL